MNDSLKSRYNTLFKSYNRLDEFKIFSPQTEHTKEKNNIVYSNAKDLCNKLLTICYIDYKNIPDEEKKGWVKNMILKIYLLKVKD